MDSENPYQQKIGHDHFLETLNYYRKYSIRDSSTLFRAVSLLLYETQTHHLQVRQECVEYMRKNKELYQESLQTDIDTYLDNLSDPRTPGKVLELKALGNQYNKTAVLFLPYETGEVLVEHDEANGFIRVFLKGDNFDLVLPISTVQDEAFCQSIVYEILYKDVFKMPDVDFAMEMMIKPASNYPEEPDLEFDGPYLKKMTYKGGPTLEMSRPENTECVLTSADFCHFHSQLTFPEFYFHLQKAIKKVQSNSHEYNKLAQLIEYCLPQRFTSCVRQLMKQGVTPISFKAARGLHPGLLRNIEFENWKELASPNQSSGEKFPHDLRLDVNEVLRDAGITKDEATGRYSRKFNNQQIVVFKNSTGTSTDLKALTPCVQHVETDKAITPVIAETPVFPNSSQQNEVNQHSSQVGQFTQSPPIWQPPIYPGYETWLCPKFFKSTTSPDGSIHIQPIILVPNELYYAPQSVFWQMSGSGTYLINNEYRPDNPFPQLPPVLAIPEYNGMPIWEQIPQSILNLMFLPSQPPEFPFPPPDEGIFHVFK